jgi:hypothetical protein
MAYFRTLQPEEMISGDVDEEAVGSRVALKCGVVRVCRPRHLPARVPRRSFPAKPSAANQDQNLYYSALPM